MRNRVRCKICGDTIESFSTHNLVFCGCGAVGVDGGRDYYRRIGKSQDIEELPYDDSAVRSNPS